MPGDVAVHQPWSRIVGLERNDQVAPFRQKSDIPARWVFELHTTPSFIKAFVFGGGLYKQSEVMPVEVDRVCQRDRSFFPRKFEFRCFFFDQKDNPGIRLTVRLNNGEPRLFLPVCIKVEDCGIGEIEPKRRARESKSPLWIWRPVRWVFGVIKIG